MPIEVRELVIKATILPEGQSSAGTSSTTAGSPAMPAEETIKFCVDKVLEILKERNGR